MSAQRKAKDGTYDRRRWRQADANPRNRSVLCWLGPSLPSSASSGRCLASCSLCAACNPLNCACMEAGEQATSPLAWFRRHSEESLHLHTSISAHSLPQTERGVPHAAHQPWPARPRACRPPPPPHPPPGEAGRRQAAGPGPMRAGRRSAGRPCTAARRRRHRHHRRHRRHRGGAAATAPRCRRQGLTCRYRGPSLGLGRREAAGLA